MVELNMDDELMQAVSRHDLPLVLQCLNKGANPNHRVEPGRTVDHGISQPDSPLRMVIFCISDCMLDDHALAQFGRIASLLLERGADPTPAMELAEARYGKYSDNVSRQSPFMHVWRIVANAAR